MRLLEGKVVVIGGVGPAMGRSTAVRAAAQGARVVMCARTESRLNEIAAEIQEAGGEAVAVPSDMSNIEDCRRVARTAVDRFGRIDGLAMIACMEPDRTMFEDTDDTFENWRKITDFNLYATMQLVKCCLPHMPKGGSVAIVGSVSQEAPFPYTAPYAAAKAGLGAMIRSLALEYGRPHRTRDLRFNGLIAAGVAGPPYHKYVGELAAMEGRTYEEQATLMASTYPLGHVPEPDEYADALIFLLSDMSRVINGQNINANGGSFMTA